MDQLVPVRGRQRRPDRQTRVGRLRPDQPEEVEASIGRRDGLGAAIRGKGKLVDVGPARVERADRKPCHQVEVPGPDRSHRPGRRRALVDPAAGSARAQPGVPQLGRHARRRLLVDLRGVPPRRLAVRGNDQPGGQLDRRLVPSRRPSQRRRRRRTANRRRHRRSEHPRPRKGGHGLGSQTGAVNRRQRDGRRSGSRRRDDGTGDVPSPARRQPPAAGQAQPWRVRGQRHRSDPQAQPAAGVEQPAQRKRDRLVVDRKRQPRRAGRETGNRQPRDLRNPRLVKAGVGVRLARRDRRSHRKTSRVLEDGMLHAVLGRQRQDQHPVALSRPHQHRRRSGRTGPQPQPPEGERDVEQVDRPDHPDAGLQRDDSQTHPAYRPLRHSPPPTHPSSPSSASIHRPNRAAVACHRERCPLKWDDKSAWRFRRRLRKGTRQAQLSHTLADARIVRRPGSRVAGRPGPGDGSGAVCRARQPGRRARIPGRRVRGQRGRKSRAWSRA